jgi:hypothetical protein
VQNILSRQIPRVLFIIRFSDDQVKEDNLEILKGKRMLESLGIDGKDIKINLKNKRVDCAEMLQWTVRKCYSGLCRNVTVDCAEMLQWTVPKCYSGLCRNVAVDCAAMLQWTVPKCYRTGTHDGPNWTR